VFLKKYLPLLDSVAEGAKVPEVDARRRGLLAPLELVSRRSSGRHMKKGTIGARRLVVVLKGRMLVPVPIVWHPLNSSLGGPLGGT
jgi:hypothetical protein